MTIALVVAVLFLAWSNGANDNFKGVATLYGSGAVGYRTAVVLATVAAVAGSILSIVLASGVAKSFSGSGFVPPDLAGRGELLLSVAVAAATTVWLATVLGMPTSTTHALTGALLGVAWLVGFSQDRDGQLWHKFFRPLLISPLLAIVGSTILYLAFRKARRMVGVTRQTCVCVGSEVRAVAGAVAGGCDAYVSAGPGVLRSSLAIDSTERCVERYEGRVIGVGAQRIVESVHTVSAVAVCFARAVNDTPKIAALFVVTGLHDFSWPLAMVAGAMAAGGVLQSRKVAETMGHRITDLNPGQGVTANLVTAALVLGASRLGWPVSTTHVSCGAIFGIGIASRSGRWATISQIVGTWLTTLPLGALLGAGVYWCVTRGGS